MKFLSTIKNRLFPSESKPTSLEIDAIELFHRLKNETSTSDLPTIQALEAQISQLLENAIEFGQQSQAKKLVFFFQCLEKEKQLVELGFNKWVSKYDINQYQKQVKSRVVKITNLAKYERLIPEHAKDAIRKTRDIFSDFLIVFTDYTKEAEQKIQVAKIQRDPILFGVFVDGQIEQSNSLFCERCYFLADWEDEFCDLTFDRFVSEYCKNGNSNPTRYINEPITVQQIEERYKTAFSKNA